ncbi:amidohydrolase family protein [Sphingomonas bacterium]|uniref:amidohydrolase family protein n=1 Tax=Sphingomonas bacterium TaxID=1895847 RepID=UPI0015761B23|nr:amidohydrolase family protein [Sphingomonas bacterium]
MTRPSRIDVHHHYLPDIYVRSLEAAGKSPPDGMPATPSWSENEALAAMDRLGIAKAYLSISSPGVHLGDDADARVLARAVNDEGARLKRQHPDRFGFFASTPLPDIDGALAEIARACDELHADGVVFETNFHGLYLGDPELAPVYAELDRRGAVLFLHPTGSPCGCFPTPHGDTRKISLGYPIPMLEFIFDTTRTVTQMIVSGTLVRYPNIRLVVPHAGAALPVLASRIETQMELGLKPDPAAPRDIHAALRAMWFDLAGSPVPDQLAALLRVADPDHLLYGSDWPFTPVAVCERLLDRLLVTNLIDDGLRSRIMETNAISLFA